MNDYNQPRIVSTRMKLTQKVYHFTVFENFPTTSSYSLKFPPNKIENLPSWACEVIVTGMFTLGGWWGMEWQAKVRVQMVVRHE